MPKIETIKRADGSQRYRFTLDVGRDPVTGKRRQRRYTFARMKDARAELGRLTGAVADGTYTDRWDGTVDERCDACLASASFEKADNTQASLPRRPARPRQRLGRRKAAVDHPRRRRDLRDWMLAQGRGAAARRARAWARGRCASPSAGCPAAFAQAVQDGRLAGNPGEHVTLPAQVRGGRRSGPRPRCAGSSPRRGSTGWPRAGG